MTKTRDLADLGGGFIQVGATVNMQRTVESKLQDVVSVLDFIPQSEHAAIKAGTSTYDCATSIQAALNASKNIVFPAGTYRMNSGVSVSANNVCIDYGNAIIVHGGTGGFLFSFGSASDTPVYSGLNVTGGTFTQLNTATTDNNNYILVRGTSSFSIRNVIAKNVSNGGICVQVGCEKGLIEDIKVEGRTQYSVIRGIWLDGSSASDYASQLVDTGSITRNATALPVYSVDGVTVKNCTITGVQYGVYLMNARNCSIEGCNIDISGSSALRCVAINNYSPNARIIGNAFTSDRSSTGILVTQASDGVIISNNVFRGSFGGNRDIYVQYLAEASIDNNQFFTTSTQNIEISMGGFALIKGNHFNRGARVADNRCVYAHPIDAGDAGTAIGDTATVLPGLIFRENIVRYRCLGVLVDTNSFASTSGNKPAMSTIDVSNNTFFTMDLAASASEYPLNVGTGTSANVSRFRYEGNVVLPAANSNKNRPEVTGSAFYNEATQAYIAGFSVANAAGGGAVTVTKLCGANISLTASRSGDDIVLVPRTTGAGPSAGIAIPFGLTDLGGTIYRFAIRRSGANYVVSVYDSGGSQIALSTTAASFNVVLGPDDNT